MPQLPKIRENSELSFLRQAREALYQDFAEAKTKGCEWERELSEVQRLLLEVYGRRKQRVEALEEGDRQQE